MVHLDASGQRPYYFKRTKMRLASDVGFVEYANAVIVPFAIQRIGANKRAIKGACQVFVCGAPGFKS